MKTKFHEICVETVNGFHDSILHSIETHFDSRTIDMNIEVDITPHRSSTKQLRMGRFSFFNVSRFSIDDHAWKQEPLYRTILSFDLRSTTGSTAEFEMFMAWEGFIRIACADFSFQWLKND